MAPLSLPLETPKEAAMQALRNAVMKGFSMGQIRRLELEAWRCGATFVECDSLISSAFHSLHVKQMKPLEKAAS